MQYRVIDQRSPRIYSYTHHPPPAEWYDAHNQHPLSRIYMIRPTEIMLSLLLGMEENITQNIHGLIHITAKGTGVIHSLLA